METSGKIAKKRMRSKLERRQIVEETLQPGASVARVARGHDVNANQVFAWRKLYRDGRLEAEQGSGRLLPVKISNAIQKLRSPAPREAKAASSGIIDIDLGHARVRIEGAADPDCVRAAVESLL